jgi:hypothetical protein
MKEQLVRIHARLCGDGCISTYETSEPDRNRRGVVLYTNMVDRNIHEFRNDMKEVFGVKMTRYNEDVKVKSLRIIEDLEDRFGSFNSGAWLIPDEIFDLNSVKKYHWIRAFVRDEGYHNEKRNCLRIKSVNKEGLEDAKKLMETLGIEPTLSGPNCDESYYLSVFGLERYPKLQKICENKPKVK